MSARIGLAVSLVVLPFSLVMPHVAEGRTIFVDMSAGGDNNGTTWVDAYRHLQDALATASAGGEIWVGEGTYKPDRGRNDAHRGDREATFRLRNGVAVYGGFRSGGTWEDRDVETYRTILSGDLASNDSRFSDVADLTNDPNRNDNSYHVVTGSGTSAVTVLDGFTVTGGNANAPGGFMKDIGGGMYSDGGSPTVTNCTFTMNSTVDRGGGMFNNNFSNLRITNCDFSSNLAAKGGGIYNSSSSPRLTDCAFTENVATKGAGACNEAQSSPLLSSCVFRRNSANEGGGMYNEGQSDPELRYCRFSANSVEFYGGGISNYRSSPTLVGCFFNGNSTVWGGGGALATVGGAPTLTNCIFSGNVTGSDGGGLYGSGARRPKLVNCTFVANQAGSDGGGAYILGQDGAILANCIFWANRDDHGGAEAAQIWVGRPGMVEVYDTCVHGGWSGAGAANIDAYPQFADPDGPDNVVGTEDDDLRLSPGSPCIDAGDNATVPPDTTDIDGDGNTTELTPWDVDRNLRFFDDPNTADTGHGTAPIVDMGAYEVSEPSRYEGLCGDENHPYPEGDLNLDCQVNLADLALLVQHWLESTQPLSDEGDVVP